MFSWEIDALSKKYGNAIEQATFKRLIICVDGTKTLFGVRWTALAGVRAGTPVNCSSNGVKRDASWFRDNDLLV